MAIASLRQLTIRGSVIELSSYLLGQILRLCSNLILTRLLFPDAFGLATLIVTFMFGLALLSDIGIEQSVIQNKRGDDPLFLDTAWALHVVRGLALWGAAALVAYPLSLVYEQPQILYLLPVAAVGIVIDGFKSTSLMRLRREVAVTQLAAINIGAQLAGMLVTVTWAVLSPSVWALVVGGLASSAVRTIASHMSWLGTRNRFRWDPEAKREILNFGRWIFGSSVMTFIGKQGDRLLLGHYMGIATLGIYSMAVFIAEAVVQAATAVTSGVLYPVFSRLQREEPARFSEVYYRAKLRLDAVTLLPIGGLMMLAQPVVDILFDDRYQSAGWMLQLLCIRAATTITLAQIENSLFALGLTRYGFFQNVVRTIWICTSIPIAWHLWGLPGIVWCVALSDLPSLVTLALPFKRLGLMRPARELYSLGLLALGMVLGYGANLFMILLFGEGWARSVL